MVYRVSPHPSTGFAYLLIHLLTYLCVDAHVLHSCGHKRITCGNWFFPSITWAPEIKLRILGPILESCCLHLLQGEECTTLCSSCCHWVLSILHLEQNDIWSKLLIYNRKDGSVGRGDCLLSLGSQFKPQNPYKGRRREPFHKVVLWQSHPEYGMCAWIHILTFSHAKELLISVMPYCESHLLFCDRLSVLSSFTPFLKAQGWYPSTLTLSHTPWMLKVFLF